MRALVFALLATFMPGSFASRLRFSAAMVLDEPDKELPKSSSYGSKAWRATHGVHIGMECEGSTMQIEMGGSAINSVYKKSPKACGALCEKTAGCVAWSWNMISENCYAQNSCERRLPNSTMVSGMKASFRGMWYYKNMSDVADFNIDHPHSFWIHVNHEGEMNLERVGAHDEVDARGKLEMASGSGHDAQQTGDELEVSLEGNDQTSIGTMRVRLADGKITLRFWLPEEDNPTELQAEKKKVHLEPFQRVTIKEDQVIAASDVRFWTVDMPAPQQPFILKKGDGGTVDNSRHPRKTGVIFDKDPDKVVWVSDALLFKPTLLEEVSEEEVMDVLENVGDDLILAISDPITKKILRDPVKAADGYTYERRYSNTLTPDFTIRSLVSSVIEKVNAARATKPTFPEEVSEEQVKAVLKNLGDDLIVAMRDPITWQILRDPVKAADGFTHERRSIEEWIWQAQVDFKTPNNQFGTPLSSVKLTPDYTIRSLVSSVIQKVKVARAAREKIQKHLRGFQVKKDTWKLEAKLAVVERQMEDNRRQSSEHQPKLSSQRRRGMRRSSQPFLASRRRQRRNRPESRRSPTHSTV